MPDITELLNRIKENISAVEHGERRAPILEEIEADFVRFMELAKLFLISERDIYYGYFLLNMQLRVNFSIKNIAGIRLNEFPPVFETNPLLLCKFTLKEIMYVICHEIDHIVFNHPAEMLKANPNQDPDIFYEFNLAADAAVNERINYEIETENRHFLAAPEGLITSLELAQIFELHNVCPLENYAYYFELIKNQENCQRNDTALNGQERILSSKTGNNNEPNEDSLTNDATNENQIVTINNCGSLQDHNWAVGDDAEDAAVIIRELVNMAVSMMNDETRAMMPGSFFSQVDRLNTPAKLSWQSILKKYIGTISANKRKTRMRLNRRQPERFDLSGTVDDKVLKIVVAIDTSASVSDQMMAKIFAEIFAILAKRKYEITIIECDAKINRVYQAKNVSEIKIKVTGRGGTWFSPVIEYVNNDRYFRDALLIYFTDGYGERTIPKPLTYRNMWVVFQDAANLSLKEPYGVVLSLEEI